MHVHLDPVGGISGDMFAAAVLDAWPDLEEPLREALRGCGLDRIATVARHAHGDGVLTGSRFEVAAAHGDGHAEHAHGHGHAHRRYREVRSLVAGAALDVPVRDRALDVFRRLGEAEARVHGIGLDEVGFHEVGAWDSIADVVTAAWLVEAIGAPTWSCAALPLGRGRVHTAHGELAVPAPATTLLLEGFPVIDDGRAGERVTPTGAAILRHLAPTFAPRDEPMRLLRSGTGFGTRRLDGMSNVLRLLAFEPGAHDAASERVAVCAFEVDDQTPEDLAVGLDRLRESSGVLDVTQAAVFGKKGRISVRVQVLARPDALDDVVATCLEETATLGVRWQIVARRTLARERLEAETGGRRIRVKQATRPGGGVTRKAEMDDLAAAGGRRARESLRRRAEAARTGGADDAVGGGEDG